MAMRARESALAHVTAFCDCVVVDVMPAIGNIEERAEQIADSEYERLCSLPAGEYCDGDMAAAAEAANDKGTHFFQTMAAVRQSVLNLFAAGLFHLVEQELADLCWDGAFLVPPPSDTKLEPVTEWYKKYFGLDLKSLPSWPVIDELRLVANTIKHGEGGSARALRARRPELLEHPLVRELMPDEAGGSPSTRLIRLPLGGEDLYVTEQLFQGYSEAASGLMREIVGHFEAHENEYYPRA